MKAKRVFLIVLDSVGIGYQPDAANFGDHGANTMKRISASAEFNIPNLISLGLGNIDGVDYLPKAEKPLAAVARIRERSKGKDTTTGHWEMMGIVSERPMPTYPDGFPTEILDEFSRRTGRGVLCNKPYSGTDVIRDFGKAHVDSGDLIVYTSADSVFQIAAHEELVPPEKLYEYCRIAREILVGEHAVGRVIARPFVGTEGAYKRTENRHDFSLTPPRATAMDAIGEAGLDVISIGKIYDIFSGAGIKKSLPTHNNGEGMQTLLEVQKSDFHGFCFANLVDFDMLYGHRQDIDGYAAALTAFDSWLPEFLDGMKDGDVLMITADHGCDPGDESTDHTREHVPLLVYGKDIKPENLGTRIGFAEIGSTVCDMLGVDFDAYGAESLAEVISK
ncbi:MAG: phosphopentomutase [Clostridia bacterium]|nr:phosphopentomutase [Clostridia bacterium]